MPFTRALRFLAALAPSQARGPAAPADVSIPSPTGSGGGAHVAGPFLSRAQCAAVLASYRAYYPANEYRYGRDEDGAWNVYRVASEDPSRWASVTPIR
ncbi:hypothetical protein ACIQFU_24710 [Streptomyces sp. NPDC093065]|uniref:hypothetical protein n=1 Tax=Streptomyces sp. NPDC093065 TaxID=3366021 RepID=UPI003828C7E3